MNVHGDDIATPSFPTRRSSDLRFCYYSLDGRFQRSPMMLDGPDSIEGMRASLKETPDRKSTRLNSSHVSISYAVFCLKTKKGIHRQPLHPGPIVPLLRAASPSA